MMKFTRKVCGAAALAAGSALFLAAAPAGAQTVNNGTFDANDELFGEFPGYVGGANPAEVTGFTGPAGGFGINGGDSPTGDPFLDGSGLNSDATLFIQGAGTTLTQAIGGLTVGQQYTLTFDFGARGCCGGTPGLDVSIGGQTFSTGGIAAGAPGTGTLTFTAGADTETLSITKVDIAPGDSTALIDSLAFAVIPEPASLGLLALGGLGLMARRRRA